MTAATIANHANHANPPLPFTRDAIIGQLRRQATNGPAYVQHSATKALAHLKGLYAEARYEAKLAVDAAREALKDAVTQVKNGSKGLGQHVAGLVNGSIQATPEELAQCQLLQPVEDEDETHETEPEDDPP